MYRYVYIYYILLRYKHTHTHTHAHTHKLRSHIYIYISAAARAADENEEPELDDVIYTVTLCARQMTEEVKVSRDAPCRRIIGMRRPEGWHAAGSHDAFRVCFPVTHVARCMCAVLRAAADRSEEGAVPHRRGRAARGRRGRLLDQRATAPCGILCRLGYCAVRDIVKERGLLVEEQRYARRGITVRNPRNNGTE